MQDFKLNSSAKDVSSYIASCPVTVQEVLEKLRSTIQEAVPEAEETISYKMPAFKYYGMLVYFAAYKNHIGFYATPTGHKEFEKNWLPINKGKVRFNFH